MRCPRSEVITVRKRHAQEVVITERGQYAVRHGKHNKSLEV